MHSLLLSDLSSRGIGSGLEPNTEIVIEKFNLTSLSQCNESIETKNYQTFIDAVNDHVSVDINVLSIRDFYQIVAYLRILTFPTSPLSLDWNCKGVMFQNGDLVANGIEVLEHAETTNLAEDWTPIECGEHNHATFSFEDLPVIKLAEDFKLDDRMDIPRVKHLAEYRRMHLEPRYSRIVPTVAWLKEGETLEDKLRILHDDMDLFDACSIANKENTHGLVSKMVAGCPRCNTEVSKALYIDNTSFFRG